MNKSQSEAFDKFKKLKVGALFMKQGTGKTKVVLKLAEITPCDLALFIVPHSLINNLIDEINKWGFKKKYIIETYQGISMSDKRYLDLIKKIEKKNIIIIADESIFIKNENSKTFQRMLKLRDLSNYRLILNGTPITKNEWDLYNQMDWLSPKILKMNRDEFLKTFFTHIVYKKKGMPERDFYKFSEININYLQALISKYIFYADLKFDKKEKETYILVNGNVNEEYQNLKEKLIESVKYGDDIVIRQLRLIEKLIFTDKERLKVIYKKIKGQCIVFCNFIDEIDYLESKMDCYIIKGSVKNRNKIIEKFKNDNKPLLIMLGIGAYGHNFQFCNKIFFSSITFDYGKIEQALYRIKRIGQKNNIEYTYFESNYKIYSMIKENLVKKKELQKLVIEKFESEDKISECI